MSVSRRTFLAGLAGSLSSSALCNSPLFSTWLATPRRPQTERRLVVVHLDGGNDGINTVVPHGDAEYAKLRPTLSIGSKHLHSIGDGLGLHPNLGAFKELWDEEQLCVVQGVGYHGSSRSHFEGGAIWETGVLDSQQHSGVGWLGTLLDPKPSSSRTSELPAAAAVHVGSGGVPIALKGRRSLATTLSSLRDFKVRDPDSLRRVAEGSLRGSTATDPRAFLSRVMLGACDAAERLSNVEASAHRVEYPASELARRLELAATLIGNEHPAQVYYVKQPGYDTHVAQRFTHGRLLTELSAAVRAFLRDVAALGREDDVAVMMFSEFGRTAKENGSKGTDHGTAGPVFLAGKPVRAGVIGSTPDLGDLIEGEPKWHVDFRSVYSAVGRQWFAVEEEPFARAVGGGGEPLRLFG